MTDIKRGWVKTGNGWEPTDPRVKNIVEQIRMGTPYKTIAFQFGINISRVSQLRHRAGIQRRRQPQESI